MKERRRWEKYAPCGTCGALGRRGCRVGGKFTDKPCDGRPLFRAGWASPLSSRAPATVEAQHQRLLALNLEVAHLRSDLADRTEQVRNLQAKLERAEKLLAEIHALSK